MNVHEHQQLDQFLQQLILVRLTDKDLQAEDLIKEAVMRQPDAAYLLVQKSLLQEQALQAAQSKISELQQQIQPAHASGFLNVDPWATTGRSTAEPAHDIKPPAVASAPVQNGFPTSPAEAGSGLGSGFLGNAAITAAGVVAGSFLFQGIGNLLNQHQSGFTQQAVTGQPPEQTAANKDFADDQTAQRDNDNNDFADNDLLFDNGDADSDWV